MHSGTSVNYKMNKRTPEQEEELLSISNDITENMLSPNVTKEKLVEVIEFWRDEHDKLINENAHKDTNAILEGMRGWKKEIESLQDKLKATEEEMERRDNENKLQQSISNSDKMRLWREIDQLKDILRKNNINFDYDPNRWVYDINE